MNESNQKPVRDEERRAELKKRLDKLMRMHPVSVMPESIFVCPFDVTELIADSLIAASGLPNDTAAWADRKADISKVHLRALLLKIKSGEIKAFDVNGAVISEYESGFTIRRADAVAYAANFGLEFTDMAAIDTAPEQAHPAPTVETVTPAPVALVEPATPAPVEITSDNEQIRYEVLASRTELIDAFSFYGVELKIFKAQKDRPGLQAACRVKGQGQKGGRAEPMFCPLKVIDWLVKSGVRGKPKLTAFMGWHILETKFPNVYAEHSIGDPRQT